MTVAPSQGIANTAQLTKTKKRPPLTSFPIISSDLNQELPKLDSLVAFRLPLPRKSF